MTHTPGPWEVIVERKHDAYVVPYGSTDDAICRANGDATNKEVIANARLIAAAPDLLEVVEAMAGFDGRNNNAALKRMAVLALIKARDE